MPGAFDRGGAVVTTAESIKLALQGAGYVAEIIARYIAGDDSREVRRVIDILPGDLRSEVELQRQRALAEAELRAAGLE